MNEFYSRIFDSTIIICDRNLCVMNLSIKRANINNNNARHSVYTARHKEELDIDRFAPVDEIEGNG